MSQRSGLPPLFAGAERLLEASGLTVADLDALVVGLGPGRYTSLRIGLASARGAASALGIPVSGVSTIAALAAGSPGCLALIDARRGEVFAQSQPAADGEPLCVAPAELSAEGRLCIGDGALEYREVLEAGGALVPASDDARHRPSVRELVRLAHFSEANGELEPIYLRVPDAERTRKEFRRA